MKMCTMCLAEQFDYTESMVRARILHPARMDPVQTTTELSLRFKSPNLAQDVKLG